MDLQRFAHRATPPSTTKLRIAWLIDNWGVLILAPLVLAFFISIVMAHRSQTNELANSPVETARAILMTKVWSEGADGNSGWVITMKMNG